MSFSRICSIVCILGVMAALICTSCGRQVADSAISTEGRLPVFVGIPPLAYLVEQIGGEHVKVDVLVQPGQDPHTFEPRPQQILALSKARLFFQIGMSFENVLLDKIKEGNKHLIIVDTTRGIQKHTMETDSCDHGHENSSQKTGHLENNAEDEHAGELDPHVWLSLPLLKQMAQNIAVALENADSANAHLYAENLAVLLDRMDALHAKISLMLEPYRGQVFYVFHPGFGYFADAYGLKQVAVEAGGRSPSPKQMQALIEKARKDRVKVIFVQPQSPQQSAWVIAEAVGGKVVTINGLAKDVLFDIEDIATKVDAALKSP